MPGAIFKGGKIAEGVLAALNYEIDSDQNDVDLYDWLVANKSYPGSSADVNVTITSGTNVSATGTGTAAMIIDRSEFPAGITLTVTNDGTIRGKGGAGGSSASNGAAGGGALQIIGSGCTLNIDNLNGEINGGGGGGGGGGTSPGYNLNGKDCNGACATANGGAGGDGYGPNAAGSGAAGGTTSCGCADGTGGTGGAGGGKGAAGSNGSNGSPSNGNAGVGGAAGYAVSGDTNVNSWINLGTRNGSVS